MYPVIVNETWKTVTLCFEITVSKNFKSQYTGWGKSRFTIMRIQSTELFLVLLFINYCIILHTNNCKPILPTPVIWKITIQMVKTCLSSGIISPSTVISFYLFICLVLERGREGEREGKKHQSVVASCAPPTGDLAYNPGMCPDWESKRWPLASQAGAQSTEPHQPGQTVFIPEFHCKIGFPLRKIWQGS